MTLGWRAVALVLVGLAPVLQWPSMSTVRWWLLLCLVVIAVDLLLAPSPKKLTVDRSGQEQVRLGEPSRTTLTVTNPTGRAMRGSLRDAWVPSAGTSGERHTLDVPGGERRRYVTDLLPTRRGDRPADRVTLRVWGPLGVAARQESRRVPGSVRALPPFHSRRHLPSRLAQLRQLDGRSAVRTRGQGTEFDSLRDYVEGDDVRSIDWRATARRQHVVVRTWQPERDRRVILVLDTSRTSAARIDDQPRLDAAMDASLLLAALASRAGDRIDLIAGDRRVRGRVTPNTDRRALLHQLVTAMAPIEPVLVEADWTMLAGKVTGLTRRRALVVLLTALEPAAIEEGLIPVLPALTAHHRVVVASVADPELGRMRSNLSDLKAVYDAAAAERTGSLRQRTADALERMGVHVIDADPEELPPRLADHYLALKAQGLL
ncbi:DUF58 domain-containing protein [Ornithinimicrobium cryptoxanthini]|uniref:DUF58 domain-containing protein n=1 Tax=Ornithinimicrobium cryptoxanthini TaxID=2934161 RepID=A0ABY4YKC0_9MICO|nr:DUF58 domain-containing protein [Ornithinimicrobium cryptoxanthini]USQ77227.1 DUF58 domain-containing protein [Ornithinimicrobium cryptoxanthini]